MPSAVKVWEADDVHVPKVVVILFAVVVVAGAAVGATLLITGGGEDKSAEATPAASDGPCITTPKATELCGQAAEDYCDEGYDPSDAYKAQLACIDAGLKNP